MRLALPAKRTLRHILLELTHSCNLDCVYCYKGLKARVHMDERVAKNGVDWLLDADRGFYRAH